jgi:Hydantoinase B/oxoprolinase
MPHIIAKYRDKFRPGDVIISNNPYGGLSHLPDIALVLPIFWRGEHRGFAAVVQHHTDIGGRFPGGMGLVCTQIYEEGLRLPAVRFYENNEPIESVREIIAAAVRAPDEVLGDLEAGIAACRRGERAAISFRAFQVIDCKRATMTRPQQTPRHRRAHYSSSYPCNFHLFLRINFGSSVSSRSRFQELAWYKLDSTPLRSDV